MVSDKRPQWLLLIFWEEHVPLLYQPEIWFDLSCLWQYCWYHLLRPLSLQGNFGSLINHVSACIGKVITVKKTAMLLLSFSVCTSIDSFGLPSLVCFSLLSHIWILYVLAHWQTGSLVSLKNLFNISIHKRCFWQ